MDNKKQDNGKRKGTAIAIAIATFFFALYVLNVLIGKATVVYGWKVFHFGNVGEFILLLVASTAFIAAALIREAAWKSRTEPDRT